MRALRVLLGFAARTAAILLLFGFALVVGVIVHVSSPPARRMVVSTVNSILVDEFKGRILLTSVDQISLRGVRGVRGVLRDPEGGGLLVAEQVNAQIELPTLLRSLASAQAPLTIVIPAVDIDYAEVVLREDEHGEITWKTTFESKTEATTPPKKGRVLDLRILQVHARRVWAHGRLGGSLVIDGDVDNLAGAVSVIRDETTVDIGRADVLLRATLPDDVRATLSGRLVVPPEGELRARVTTAAQWRQFHCDANASLHDNQIDGHALIKGGDGDAAVDARVDLGDEIRVQAHVIARALDPSTLAVGAPSSAVSGIVDTTVVVKSGDVAGTFALETQPTRMVGQDIPAIAAKGEFTTASVKATVHVNEIGAPIDIALWVRPESVRSQSFGVEFEAHGDAPVLQQVPRLGGEVAGAFGFATKGHVAFDGPDIDLELGATGDRLRYGAFGVAHIAVSARARGRLDAARFNAELRTAQLTWNGHSAATAVVRAEGSVRDLQVHLAVDGGDVPNVRAYTTITTAPDRVLRDTHVSVSRGATRIALSAPNVTFVHGGVDTGDVEIRGLGEPVNGAFRYVSSRIRAKLVAPRIDFEKVAAVLPLRDAAPRGYVSLDAEWNGDTKGVGKGHVVTAAHGDSFETIGKLDVDLSALVDHGEVTVNARLEAGEIGSIVLSAPHIRVPGPVFEANPWRAAVGTMDVRGGADVAALAEIAPDDFPDVSGWVDLRAAIVGRGRAVLPDVRMMLETHGLTVSEVLAEVDGRVQANVDGQTGDAAVNTLVWDHAGVLVGIDAKTKLPLHAHVRSGPLLKAALASAPYRVRGAIPRRRLRDVLALAGTTLGNDAVEIATDFSYNGRTAKLDLSAFDGDRRVLDGDVQADVVIAEFIKSEKPSPWKASAKIRLDGLPLDVFSTLEGPALDGRLNGSLALTNLGSNAAFDALIEGDSLMVSNQALPKARFSVNVHGGSVNADVQLAQAGGSADVRFGGGLVWGAALLPKLDDDPVFDVTYNLANFRIKPFSPWFRGMIRSVDGWLDGFGKVHVMPAGEGSTAEGELVLRDGELQSPAMGGVWSHIGARIQSDSTGRLVFDRIAANGIAGRLTASGGAKLDGFALRNAELFVRIEKKESVPISIDGEPIGQMWGHIDARADVAPSEGMSFEIGVPTLHLELPRGSPHDLQALDDQPRVAIGVRNRSGDLVAVPLKVPVAKETPTTAPIASSSTPIHVNIKLGKDVFVTKGAMLNVQLDGNPRIDAVEQTRLSGQINVRGGHVEFSGRRFVLEYGTLTFVGQDPSNPTLVATASWVPPNQSQTNPVKVFIEFKGPIKTGKVSLRSEPSYSESEILNLVAFGAVEGQGGSASVSSGGSMATNLLFSQGIGQALSRATTLNVSAQVATNAANNPRPELRVQITPKIAAQVGYNTGAVTPQTPDRTIGSVDWRFLPRWSLLATYGDAGTTLLDMLWNYRY